MTQEKKFSMLPALDRTAVLLRWLAEHKAHELAAWQLPEGNPLAETVILASASSARHARSLADGLLELCGQEHYEYLRMEGYQSGLWVLVDLNDIIVHLLQESVREMYRLEGLWRDARPLDAPAPPSSLTADGDEA